MTPSLGRIVLVTLPEDGRDAEIHPAIVTAVHSDTMINARAMVDRQDNPPWLTSIPRADSVGDHYAGISWSWPPRVEG